MVSVFDPAPKPIPCPSLPLLCVLKPTFLAGCTIQPTFSLDSQLALANGKLWEEIRRRLEETEVRIFLLLAPCLLQFWQWLPSSECQLCGSLSSMAQHVLVKSWWVFCLCWSLDKHHPCWCSHLCPYFIQQTPHELPSWLTHWFMPGLWWSYLGY